MMKKILFAYVIFSLFIPAATFATPAKIEDCQDKSKTTCPSGCNWSDSSGCKHCPAGSYCPDSETKPTCPASHPNSEAGATSEEDCYQKCKQEISNGSISSNKQLAYYNESNCTYTIKCNAGYYADTTNAECKPCPMGSTSKKGQNNREGCYINGYTKFCDKDGQNCFDLPDNVDIFYANF